MKEKKKKQEHLTNWLDVWNPPSWWGQRNEVVGTTFACSSNLFHEKYEY